MANKKVQLDIIFMGERRGSNPRQPESQSGALPAELRPPYRSSQFSTSIYGQTSARNFSRNAHKFIRAWQESNLPPPA